VTIWWLAHHIHVFRHIIVTILRVSAFRLLERSDRFSWIFVWTSYHCRPPQSVQLTSIQLVMICQTRELLRWELFCNHYLFPRVLDTRSVNFFRGIFLRCSQRLDAVASNINVICEWRIGKDQKRKGHGRMEVLPRHWAEGSHETFECGFLMSDPRFEANASRIRLS
jgi:hypothetical protein